MPIDTGPNLPISGGVLIASLLYAGTSVFVLGPLVAERTIEKSNWNATCEAGLQADIEAQRSPPKIIPRTDCQSTIGAFMPELAKLCNHYGNPDFGGPMTSLLKQQENLRQQAEERRLAVAASQSSSQCDCAAALVAQDQAWAIHAGSLRLITPPQVNTLSSELTRALNTPHCNSGRASS